MDEREINPVSGILDFDIDKGIPDECDVHVTFQFVGRKRDIKELFMGIQAFLDKHEMIINAGISISWCNPRSNEQCL